MALFQPDAHTRSDSHRRVYAAYEVAHTIIDFLAAMLFLVGSVMFFYPRIENPAIWCFVVGSVCFALSPTLRLVRELHYLAIGDVDDLVPRGKT